MKIVRRDKEIIIPKKVRGAEYRFRIKTPWGSEVIGIRRALLEGDWKIEKITLHIRERQSTAKFKGFGRTKNFTRHYTPPSNCPYGHPGICSGTDAEKLFGQFICNDKRKFCPKCKGDMILPHGHLKL